MPGSNNDVRRAMGSHSPRVALKLVGQASCDPLIPKFLSAEKMF